MSIFPYVFYLATLSKTLLTRRGESFTTLRRIKKNSATYDRKFVIGKKILVHFSCLEIKKAVGFNYHH